MMKLSLMMKLKHQPLQNCPSWQCYLAYFDHFVDQGLVGPDLEQVDYFVGHSPAWSDLGHFVFQILVFDYLSYWLSVRRLRLRLIDFLFDLFYYYLHFFFMSLLLLYQLVVERQS